MTTSTRSRRRLRLRLNGTAREWDIPPDATLLELLRDRLGLTGTKAGCERGECGSCTVLRDGLPVYSCLLLALECQDTEIVTIEALPVDDPVLAAIVAEDGLQCGYCTPGQALALTALLARHPDPTDEQILEGLSGNLCRCGAYSGLIRAARRAAAAIAEGAGAGAPTAGGAGSGAAAVPTAGGAGGAGAGSKASVVPNAGGAGSTAAAVPNAGSAAARSSAPAGAPPPATTIAAAAANRAVPPAAKPRRSPR